MSENRWLSLAAPAKINLFLHVTGRRDDGHHLLESLVVFTETGDRLFVKEGEGLILSITGPFAQGLPAGSDNLVLAAADALRRESSTVLGAHITLEKNLPVSSGIGGGSADAAAALRALSVLWDVDLSISRLTDIGLALGADVPVCINSRSAIMSGIGEILEDVDPPPHCGVVLVNAEEGVATPAVFNARTAPFSDIGTWRTPKQFDDFVEALDTRKNDLCGPARSLSPVIGEVLAALSGSTSCALARLSGSGGTCFGLYADTNSADKAAAAIKASHPEWWCLSTVFRQTIPRVTPVNAPAGFGF